MGRKKRNTGISCVCNLGGNEAKEDNNDDNYTNNECNRNNGDNEREERVREED